MNKTFLAGYSRQAFTPDYQVHLTGYGDDEFRKAEGVADDVCMTCVAVTSGEDTILMYSGDLLSLNGVAAKWIRDLVCPATGIPADHIFFGATHSHNAPNYYHEYEGSAKVREAMLEAALKAAKEAAAKAEGKDAKKAQKAVAKAQKAYDKAKKSFKALMAK